tara:strand:+ start:531 stop:986 length:456 start_codon:yes stop_codon:yes gene_type:complete
MNTQFNVNVYHFTHEMMKELFKGFNGKVVGESGMEVEDVMNHFFEDFKPGEDVVHEESSLKKSSKKKKKKVSDPTKPKRPTTAFFYYVASIRAKVKDDNPGLSVGEMSKIHSAMWGKLSDKEKEPFEVMNTKDKERYKNEMDVWKEKENKD